MLIETENLTKYYGDTRGIEGVDLNIEEGEVFGFLGPNGSGKTTMIHTLLDFIRPTDGQARIFGLDSHRDTMKIHARTGFLPGELALYQNMTGGQLLRYLAHLRGDVDWEYVLQLAERLEADLSVKVKAYSSGNKHKIGIIQAFMHRPELLILDEPTMGLDPLMQHTFYEMIAEAQQTGQTVFLSSHNLSEVEHICDRIGIIRKGRLIEVETVEELREKSVRQLVITFDGAAPAEPFEKLSVVDDVEAEDGRLRLTVKGKMNEVVKTASEYNVIDLTSKVPSLEEVFLEFYGGEDV